MKSLSHALSEDTNQFGPGTDLTVSLLSVLLVMTLITAYLYRVESDKNSTLREKIHLRDRTIGDQKDAIARTQAELDKNRNHSGNFRLASDFFSAADFRVRPVTQLVDRAGTARRVSRIVDEYRRIGSEYPYIFIIGHSNVIDDPSAADRSLVARRQRNWEYAARRATLIAGLMQRDLDDGEMERVVVVTTGELDLRRPLEPTSQENAWVEVVFGKEWKRPERKVD